jgi:uncharacterized protein
MTTRLLRRGGRKPVLALSGAGVFVGYASLFGKRDRAGDIVMPGAFTQSLRDRGTEGIRMLFQHDPSQPVGTWLEITEEERGLWVRGRLDMNVQRGRELQSLLESGGIDGLSIGFKTQHAVMDRKINARRITKIDLWEISLVTFPMLDGARVSKVATRAKALAEQLFMKSPQKPQNSLQEHTHTWK